MGLGSQAAASAAAYVIAKKIRDLIELAESEHAKELLREALKEAERIQASADSGWF